MFTLYFAEDMIFSFFNMLSLINTFVDTNFSFYMKTNYKVSRAAFLTF